MPQTPENRVYLFRLQMLIIDGGLLVFRNLIDQTLTAQGRTLSACLNQESAKINHLKNHGIITQEQYDILFPTGGQVPNTSQMDITLIIFLLRCLKCFGLNKNFDWTVTPMITDTSIEADICRLKAYRNEISHLTQTTDIDANRYGTLWNDIEQILVRQSSPPLNIHQTIANFKTCLLDPGEEKRVQEEIQIWKYYFEPDIDRLKEEIMKAVIKMFTEFEKAQEETNRRYDEQIELMKRQINALLKAFEILGLSTNEVTTVKASVKLRASEQRTAEELENELLTVSKESLTHLESSEPNKTVRKMVDNLVQDMNDKGFMVEDVSEGSIVYTIKCQSFEDLIDLIDYFDSPMLKRHLEAISRALTEVTGKKIEIHSKILTGPLSEELRRHEYEMRQKSTRKKKLPVRPNVATTDMLAVKQENTVDLKTKSAKKLPKEAEPLQTTEDTVALETESAEKLPKEAESLQTTEDNVVLEQESAEMIAEGTDPLQPTEYTVALETESAEKLPKEAESLQTTDTGNIRFDDNESDFSQNNEFAETDDSNPVESDIERPYSATSEASTETEGQAFYQVLHRLGLTDKFPGKISMRDVIAVDPNESIEQKNDKLSLTDIPWLVLKRLMCAHSESRDIRVSEEENTEDSFYLEDSISCFSEIQDVNQDISPLDIFTVVFQCCDPFLKQIFVQKLYLCKLAVPFLYRYWGKNEKHCQVLSIWPLRSLAIECKSNANKNEMQGRESDVLDLKTKVVAFGRLGRPRYSKSKLMNSLLLGQGCKTFFNIDCPSGMTPRQLSNGQIEMFWLPTIDERRDRFQDALTIFNLRGDLGQHFSQDLLYFISHLIDSIVIIIDLDTVLRQSKMVEDILIQFSSVILIIADPFNRDAIKPVQSLHSAVTSSSNSTTNLRIVSTHKGTVEKNVVDMLSSITKTISNQLKTNKTMSLEDRFSSAKKATVHSDEDDQFCQQAMQEAFELIKQMKAEGEPSGWKQRLTPVHGKFTKQLGKLVKERERERDFTEGVKIDEKIKTVRRQQIESITKIVESFLDILIKNNSPPSVLNYFLCWLHIFIEREKRQILPRLMHANQSAWEKLKALKSAKNPVKEEIEKKETIITDLEENINEASFAVQDFFREIGHIYEAILELKEDTEKLRLPNVHQMSSIIGRLVAHGHQLELIDGESFYMPYKWIKAVLQNVDRCIESSKVMTLGVLGRQSSGKSTLLNTMFGSQFSSRTGRCTRGIHVQLIPTKTEQAVFSYALIVDTEGLRSPELSHMQHEHDNELATVITGVGDITMLYIMGENTSEIRDILQVIVRAFLRLKMANEKLDIRKSCAFIHQNVTDTSASENLVSGLSKLIQTLDEMTKESARSEGLLEITTFNQVIEFDINNQVWYLKNVWQGNPPMARVNNEYSKTVVDIKCKILKKALTMKNKSYKSLNDILEQAHSLWKGVLNEDFVFSFRNSLEIKAYMDMESFVQAELWRLESLTHDKIILNCQNGFATCDRNEKLRTVADDLISKLNECLINEKIKTEANIETYFEGSKYKDIIIQWKNIQQTRMTILCEKLQQIIKEHVEKCQMTRSLEILTVTCHGKHEEELRKRSVDVANQYKGHKISSKKIDELFSDIWETFLKKVDTSPTSTKKHRQKMRIIFQTCLENIFKKNHALLKEALQESGDLTPLSNVKQLANSFDETRINNTDISFTAKLAFVRSETLKYIENRVNEIFASLDRKIKELCQVDHEVTEMSVNELMHELDSSIQAILTGESKYIFKMTFYVKIYVHVSRHVHPVFESHNEKYFKTHDTAILLEKYREQQKISFESHLRCRQFEDIVATLFANVIECFAEEWTSQIMPRKVMDELRSLLPKVKNRVIIEICTDLLKGGNFKNFVKYIEDPHIYASTWITEKANKYLDNEKFPVIASTASLLLKNLFGTVKKCALQVQMEYDGISPPSIETWLESFQSFMKSADYCIPSESFRNVRKETSSSIQNVEYLTTTISDYLSKSEENLVAKFKSQTSQTITWATFNPISRILKEIWGCQEQCPFCGEPCAKNEDHGDSTHICLQHRPSCCRGIRNSGTQKACLESCGFDIQSNKTHTCPVFKNACDADHRKGCGKIHNYRDYKTYLPKWDIAPTSNMHDSSKYWMWFVATYKDELKNHYNYKIDHIPSSWNNINKSEAEQSLHTVYSA